MKTKNFILLYRTIISCLVLFTLLLFTGCSDSPENVGIKLAEKVNENCRQYLLERQQVEAEFIRDFNASNYTTRDDALKDYDHRLTDVIIAYQNRKREIDNECSEVSLTNYAMDNLPYLRQQNKAEAERRYRHPQFSSILPKMQARKPD